MRVPVASLSWANTSWSPPKHFQRLIGDMPASRQVSTAIQHSAVQTLEPGCAGRLAASQGYQGTKENGGPASRSAARQRYAVLVDDDASDGLSLVHELEALVDVLERQLVGDQVVDVDLLLHIPVDDLRDVGPAPGAAKGRALPDPAGHQLERTGRDLLPRTRNPDD